MREERDTITHTGEGPRETTRVETGSSSESMGSSQRGFWRDACYLAAVDMRCNRASYLVSLAPVVFVGFIATVLLDLTVQFEGFGTLGEVSELFYNGLVPDLWMLGLLPVLMVNFFLNTDYAARFTADNMSQRLGFLRSLPIPASVVASGRALSSLAYLCLSTPAFFIPFVIFSQEVLGRLGFAGMAAFVVVCLGYTLLAGGFYLYVWLGFSGKQDLKLAVLSMLILTGAAIALNLGFGISAVEMALLASKANGALAAAAGLTVGAISFVLWMIAASRRLKKREL